MQTTADNKLPLSVMTTSVEDVVTDASMYQLAGVKLTLPRKQGESGKRVILLYVTLTLIRPKKKKKRPQKASQNRRRK